MGSACMRRTTGCSSDGADPSVFGVGAHYTFRVPGCETALRLVLALVLLRSARRLRRDVRRHGPGSAGDSRLPGRPTAGGRPVQADPARGLRALGHGHDQISRRSERRWPPSSPAGSGIAGVRDQGTEPLERRPDHRAHGRLDRAPLGDLRRGRDEISSTSISALVVRRAESALHHLAAPAVPDLACAASSAIHSLPLLLQHRGRPPGAARGERRCRRPLGAAGPRPGCCASGDRSHRDAPGRRLQHRVQSRSTEPTAHVGHGPGAVERRQHPDPIHHQQRRRAVRALRRTGGGRPSPAATALDGAAGAPRVGSCGTRIRRALRVPAPDAGEGRRSTRLVRRPGGARHQGRRAAPEAGAGGRRAAPRPLARARCRTADRPGRGSAPPARPAERAGSASSSAMAAGRRHRLVARREQRSARASGAGRSPGSRLRPRSPPRCRSSQPGWPARARGRAWRRPGDPAQRGEQAVRVLGKIVGQVVGRVHREAARQCLGRGAEMGVDELAVGHEAAAARAARSRPGAPRPRMAAWNQTSGRVEIAARPGPVRQPGGGSSPLAVAVAQPSGRTSPSAGRQRRSEPEQRRDTPRRWTAWRQCCGGPDGRQSGTAGLRAGLAIERGPLLEFVQAVHVPPATEGGDPLSTESRVACGR